MPETQVNTEKREPIRGVFSSQISQRVGSGTTSRKSARKTYWFCTETEGGLVEVQPLNANYVPAGPKQLVPQEEFLSRFAPEPEFYVANVYPRMRELGKTLARADRYRHNREYYSAEVEYDNALAVDEENVRANFGLGITYLERGDTAKAEDIFDRLIRLEGAFEREHKHLFNEFGVKLRKSGLHDRAVAYYSRALDLAEHDEHLYYNVARAFLEKGDPSQTLRYLFLSLELNPGLDVSLRFLEWLMAQNMVPEEFLSRARAALAGRTAAADADQAPA